MLRKLTKNLLPLYREAYRTDWPKHNISFVLLDNYIKRIEKYPQWDFNKVKFYGNEAHKDATFLYDDGIFIFVDSLSNDEKGIKEGLNQLDYSVNNKLIIVEDNFKNLIHDVVERNSLEVIFENRMKSTINSDLKLHGPILEKTVLSLPDEFYLDDLKEKNVELLTEKWPYSKLFGAPEEMFRTCIKYNPSTGLFLKKDDRLIAWINTYECGMNGNFYVEEEFRKRRLGKYVMASQGLKILKEGKIMYGAAVQESETNFKIVSPLGGVAGGSFDLMVVKQRKRGKN